MNTSYYMAEPPPGILRHSTNAPNLHKELAAVGITTTIVALTAVVLRLFTRAHVTKIGIELCDHVAIGAMICSLVFLGCNFPHMKVGLGYHIWDVRTEDFMQPFQIWTLIGSMMYATSLAFSKVSILLFYLRLSPNKWFKIPVSALIAIVVIYATIYDLICLFGSRPIAATWNLRLLPGATCMDMLTKYMALSVLNIIIDVLTLVIPIPVIAGLQMPKRQKISVCCIFATGSFVCIVAIRRTTLLKPLMDSEDYTWHAVEQFQWCFAEVNAGIVCACAPALKPFFAYYIPCLLSSTFRKSNRYPNEPDYITSALPSTRMHSRNGGRKDVYDIQLRDDVSEQTTTTKRSAEDEETQLWKDTAAKESRRISLTRQSFRHSCQVRV